MTHNATASRIAINTILFATDFSPASERAYPFAVAMAKRCKSRLLLTHAVLPLMPITAGVLLDPRSQYERLHSEAERCMNGLCASESLKAVPHEAIIRSGEVSDAVAEIIRERDVELVILGTRGLAGLQRVIFGSHAEGILREMACPMMIVGPNVAPLVSEHFSRIVYATNFSDASLRALHYALLLAHADQANLTLLHIAPESEAAHGMKSEQLKREYIDKLIDVVPLEGDFWLKTETVVELGVPWEQIVRIADIQRADLIVMGAHPAGTSSTHLPSTAHYVLQHARCPVLTTHGDD
jgi:nucleotide-binding universal stress UspA family protein